MNPTNFHGKTEDEPLARHPNRSTEQPPNAQWQPEQIAEGVSAGAQPDTAAPPVGNPAAITPAPGEPPTAPAPPVTATSPATVALKPGSNFQTGIGTVTFNNSIEGVVCYDYTLRDGSVLKNERLPIEKFQAMVARAAQLPRAGTTVALPYGQAVITKVEGNKVTFDLTRMDGTVAKNVTRPLVIFEKLRIRPTTVPEQEGSDGFVGSKESAATAPEPEATLSLAKESPRLSSTSFAAPADSEKFGLKNALALARWILVLPTAFAGAWISGFLVGYIWQDGIATLFPVAGSRLEPFIVGLLRSMITPGVFVATGAQVAPVHKRQTAIALVIAWMAFMIFEAGMIGLNEHPVWNAIIIVVSTASALSGAVGAYWAATETRPTEVG